jgi:hypothetical protein
MARYGGSFPYYRYGIGVLAPAIAWSTVVLPLNSALLAQFIGFVGMYFIDSQVTIWGWAPTWYSTYRFILTFVVGACGIITLIGRGQVSLISSTLTRPKCLSMNIHPRHTTIIIASSSWYSYSQIGDAISPTDWPGRHFTEIRNRQRQAELAEEEERVKQNIIRKSHEEERKDHHDEQVKKKDASLKKNNDEGDKKFAASNHSATRSDYSKSHDHERRGGDHDDHSHDQEHDDESKKRSASNSATDREDVKTAGNSEDKKAKGDGPGTQGIYSDDYQAPVGSGPDYQIPGEITEPTPEKKNDVNPQGERKQTMALRG